MSFEVYGKENEGVLGKGWCYFPKVTLVGYSFLKKILGEKYVTWCLK